MSRVGYETSRVQNVCNSFPILPETCAKTIGQNVKHSVKAPCICCRMMIHLQVHSSHCFWKGSKIGSRPEHSHQVMFCHRVSFLFQSDVFKSSDIVYIDTFSCFLTLSVFDN